MLAVHMEQTNYNNKFAANLNMKGISFFTHPVLFVALIRALEVDFFLCFYCTFRPYVLDAFKFLVGSCQQACFLNFPIKLLLQGEISDSRMGKTRAL